MAKKRHFEFIDGASQKYWEIWRVGNAVHTQYGKLGSAGQSTVKTEADAAAAARLEARLITEKSNKGYLERSASPPAKAAKVATVAKAAKVAAVAKAAKVAAVAKAAKVATVAKAASASAATASGGRTVVDLLQLLIDQVEKHERVDDREVAVVAQHSGQVPEALFARWLGKFPKGSAWRAAAAARAAIELAYLGLEARAAGALALANRSMPAEPVSDVSEDDPVAHASAALCAAEFLVGDRGKAQAIFDRLAGTAGGDEKPALMLATLLIARQWVAAKTLAATVRGLDLTFKDYFKYAISCALRADQHALIGALLRDVCGDAGSHELLAEVVYHHTVRTKRPADLLELCVGFPAVFAKQYVLDALVDCARVDVSSALAYATKLSAIEADDATIALGSAALRFRGDASAGAAFVKSHPSLGARQSVGAKLRAVVAGAKIRWTDDDGKVLRYVSDPALVERQLLTHVRLDERSVGATAQLARKFVSIGRPATALSVLTQLLTPLGERAKGERSSDARTMAFVYGLLGEVKLGEALLKLTTPSYRALILAEILHGAVAAENWEGACQIAERIADTEVNDRMRAIASALARVRSSSRFFCALPT